MEEYEFEQIQKDHENKVIKGVKIATKNKITFKLFKEEVDLLIARHNTEDQWIFDYESFLCTLQENVKPSIYNWAEEYYDDFF
jgi:hypothetical protein